jgi:protein O-GlcNAc transferase
VTTVAEAFALALQYHRSGNLPPAELLYQQVLQVDPENADAHHLLGVLAYQLGRFDQAAMSIRRALGLNPEAAVYHCNLGLAQQALGQIDNALTSFQEAVRLQPNSADAHNALGNELRIAGKLEEAASHCRVALDHRPDFPEAHNNLGNALLCSGRPEEAIDSFRQALRLRPESPEAHNNLANALVRQGQAKDAVEHAKAALRLRPDFPEAHNNLGAALADLDRDDEAIACFHEALRLSPDFAEAWGNLGNALARRQKLDEAIQCYELVIRLEPSRADARNNLGNAVLQQGKLAEAIDHFQQALRLSPDSAQTYSNLAAAYLRQGELDEVVRCYRQALQLNPGLAEVHGNLGSVLHRLGQLDDAIDAFRTALSIKPDAAHIQSNLVLSLHYHPNYGAETYFRECRRWNEQHAELLKKLIRPHTNLADPERRLRIGYVSPDFADHVDSFFTVPLLSNHDHEQFEILCYAGVAQPNALTLRLQSYADVWRNTVGLSDGQLAELIRKDQIDILIDLKLHTANNRLLVFARKPAPVQVAWLGYTGTTGLSTVDYRLTDPYLDPPGMLDAFYSEESIRLPETFWCYDPLTDEPQVNALPALELGVVTFGSLNNFCKLNDGCLALWGKVLRAVPRSHLLLLAPRGSSRERVLARLEQEGVATSRVEFTDRQPRLDYLRTYQQIDLCLDPVPCNGHSTSLDALWMGVPAITLVSQSTAFGRAGWSQLCNIGLKGLAAQTPDQYVALAAELAADLPRLQELRTSLRQRMLQSPLMDAQRFTRHVEQSYRQMWRRWCSSGE